MAEEKVELEDVRQQEINALDAKVSSANHFEFLGVPVGASADDVRAAFREASRKFHPDRYFGKNLGSYRAKLDRIFKRLVDANQTLTDPDRREAYFAANPFLRAAARSISGSQPAQAKTPEEEARDAERRNRFARHPYLAKATKVQEFLARAKEHVEKKEYSQAFTALNTASQIDPEHAEVRSMLVEVRKQADLVRSESSYQHALEALTRGDTELALQALRVAVGANAANHKAAVKAANLLEKQGNAREATAFAQKAVEAQPKNVEYRVLLGRLLMDAGMKALGKKHFDEAVRLDPNHPEVKKHGKKLWPF
ncbi:MAG: DnaJ domain-containing protein [Myxococcota bacterium]